VWLLTQRAEQFSAYFSKFGKVTEAQIMKDRENSKPRGFGFIMFDSEDAVERVLAKIKEHKLLDKWVECKKATPKPAPPAKPSASPMVPQRGNVCASDHLLQFPHYAPRSYQQAQAPATATASMASNPANYYDQFYAYQQRSMAPKYMDASYPSGRMDGGTGYPNPYPGTSGYGPNYMQNYPYGGNTSYANMSTSDFFISTDFSRYQQEQRDQLGYPGYGAASGYRMSYHDQRSYQPDPRVYDPTQPPPMPYPAPEPAPYPQSTQYLDDSYAMPKQSPYGYGYGYPSAYPNQLQLTKSATAPVSSMDSGMASDMGTAAAPKPYNYQPMDGRNPYYGVLSRETGPPVLSEPRPSAGSNAGPSAGLSAGPSAGVSAGISAGMSAGMSAGAAGNPSLTLESEGKERKIENYNSNAFNQALGLNFQDPVKDNEAEDYALNGTSFAYSP
jgi:hypothetical protein